MSAERLSYLMDGLLKDKRVSAPVGAGDLQPRT
jgi:hypothetical protein